MMSDDILHVGLHNSSKSGQSGPKFGRLLHETYSKRAVPYQLSHTLHLTPEARASKQTLESCHGFPCGIRWLHKITYPEVSRALRRLLRTGLARSVKPTVEWQVA